MLKLHETQKLAERLSDEAVKAASKCTLTRHHLDTMIEIVHEASLAGADAKWLRKLQGQIARILEIQNEIRIATHLSENSYGRRKTIRITAPPLVVQFADGQKYQTVDWSTHGVLITGHYSDIAIGTEVCVTIASPDVDGGGIVTGRVVWCSTKSGEVALEFERPSIAVQVMKVRMMRSGMSIKSI